MRELTKEEAVIELAKFTVLMPNSTFNVIAVLNPTRIESDSFRSDFVKTLSEVPKWLQPEIVRINMSCIETSTSKILFINTPVRLKGVSLNHFYISKLHTPDQFDMAMQVACPCIYGSRNNFTIF